MKVTDWHTDWLMISWNTAANQKVTPPLVSSTGRNFSKCPISFDFSLIKVCLCLHPHDELGKCDTGDGCGGNFAH